MFPSIVIRTTAGASSRGSGRGCGSWGIIIIIIIVIKRWFTRIDIANPNRPSGGGLFVAFSFWWLHSTIGKAVTWVFRHASGVTIIAAITGLGVGHTAIVWLKRRQVWTGGVRMGLGAGSSQTHAGTIAATFEPRAGHVGHLWLWLRLAGIRRGIIVAKAVWVPGASALTSYFDTFRSLDVPRRKHLSFWREGLLTCLA